MLEISKNVLLKPYTTLKIGGRAEYFARIKSKQDLLSAISLAKDKSWPIWILGGGSNVLISKNIKGLVLKNEIKGLSILRQSPKSAWIEAKSGDSWTSLVDFSVRHDFYGLENLFLVPGTVGAAPVQNIGAYGVELKDNFVFLEAINLKTGRSKIFKKADCHFSYRESIFKGRLKGRYFIYKIVVKLSRQPNFKLDYGGISDKLKSKGWWPPTSRQLVSAIEEIRNSKLPNPSLLPNAGSFFKNPEISNSHFQKLQKDWPDIKYFPATVSGKVKIPAAWLIEKSGLKGKRFGPVGMYQKQSLILVNYGRANSRQVLKQVERVQSEVLKNFNIRLEPEVNII